MLEQRATPTLILNIYTWFYSSASSVSIKKERAPAFFFFSCCAAREKWVGCWATVRPYAMLLTIIYRQKKAARMWNKGSFIIIYFIPFRYDCYTYTYSSLVQRVEADDPRNVRLSCDSYHPTLFSFFPYFQASYFTSSLQSYWIFRFLLPLKNLRLNSFHIFPYSQKREKKKGPPLSDLEFFITLIFFYFYFFLIPPILMKTFLPSQMMESSTRLSNLYQLHLASAY